MSAQHAPPDPATWVDDRDLGDATDHDPHGIVPDTFLNDWGADSIPEALRKAEAAPSSTATYDRYRCPECESVQVAAKSKKWASEQREAGAYKCLDCGSHFAEPATPETQQQTLRDVKRNAAKSDRRHDRRGIDLIDAETCAAWRRRLRGADNWREEFTVDVWKPTGSHHVRGKCDCDHDEPALTYTPAIGGGEWEVSR